MRWQPSLVCALGAALCLGGLSAQEKKEPPQDQQKQAPKDDFKREGDAKARARKDPLEGKPAPALQVTGWMNTDGKPLSLAALRGKVIALKFWGVW